MTSRGQIIKVYLFASKSKNQNLVSKIQYYVPNQSNIDNLNFISCAVLFVFNLLIILVYGFFKSHKHKSLYHVLCLNITEVIL